MKFLILVSIIAFILEDHRTFQSIKRRKITPREEITLFKKHAIQLINATILPLRYNNEIMDQGCQCIPMIENERELEPLYLILATMSIAKDHHEELEVLRQLSDDVSLDLNRVSAGLRKNINEIITILRHSSDRFELHPLDGVLKEYLLEAELDPPYMAMLNSKFSQNLQAATKCYQLLIAMYYETNQQFFTRLLNGFSNIRDIINIDCKEELQIATPEDITKKNELAADFYAIVDQVHRCRLDDPDPNFKKDDFEELINKLNENNLQELDDKWKARNTQAFLFLVLVGVCFGGALLWTRGV